MACIFLKQIHGRVDNGGRFTNCIYMSLATTCIRVFIIA